MDIDYMLDIGKDLTEIFVEMRKESGMNIKEISEHFKIPYRTVQDWNAGKRQMPEYVLRMMAFQLKMEDILKK